MKYNTFILLVLCAVVVSTASAGIAVSYQGTLEGSSGNPITGTYSVSFSLYDVSSGGTPLATDSHTVTFDNGLFTTSLSFDQSYYDGRDLWLGIKIGSDAEMAPRQEFRPVPYALSLVPGAAITGNQQDPAVNIVNSGIGIAAYSTADSPAVIGQSADGFGVYVVGKEGGFFSTHAGGTYGNPLAGVNVSTGYDYNPGISVLTTGTFSDGIYSKTSAGASNAFHGVTGSGGYGLFLQTNGPGAWIESKGSGMCVYTTGDLHSGIISQTSGAKSDALHLTTASDESKGIYIATQGDQSDGISITTDGQWSDGLYALAKGSDSYGVYGSSSGSYGVYGETYGADKSGVYGKSVYGKGVEGLTKSTSEWTPAIYGRNEGAGDGVYGWSQNRYGTVGVSSSNTDAGVWGLNQGSGMGVYGQAAGSGVGIYGQATGSGGVGVKAETFAVGSTGIDVATHSDWSDGIAIGTTGYESTGISASATGSESEGLWAYSAKSNAIYASTGKADGKYGLYTPDYIYARGQMVPSTDLAEYFPTISAFEPGTVVIIGEENTLVMSSLAYDTRVAGIVSTEPGLSLGVVEGENAGEELIALAGRVPCKVDASYGAIHAGDLLTTSSTPGYAMKAEPLEINGRTFYPSGIVLGKALGSLEEGTGLIEVIVTLQ